MTVQRWVFTDPTTSATWTLPNNPRQMGSLSVQRRTVANRSLRGIMRVTRTPVGGTPWQFEGRVYTKTDHDTFVAWRGVQRIVITDHLGREHEVVPVNCELTPVPRTGMRNEWLYDYVFRTIYLRRVS